MKPAFLAGVLALVTVSCIGSLEEVTTTSSTAGVSTTTTAPDTTTSTSSTEPSVDPFQKTVSTLHESGGDPSRAGPFLATVVRNTDSLEVTVRESLRASPPAKKRSG